MSFSNIDGCARFRRRPDLREERRGAAARRLCFTKLSGTGLLQDEPAESEDCSNPMGCCPWDYSVSLLLLLLGSSTNSRSGALSRDIEFRAQAILAR